MRAQRHRWAIGCFAVATLAWSNTPSSAVQLNGDGTIKLGVRTYVNARVGTERTHKGVPLDNDPSVSSSATFPFSEAGHLRQNRFFVEAELHHDIDGLMKRGVGPLSLLNDLPFRVRHLGYHLTFRGEGEGIYDWGPREYSTAGQFRELAAGDPPLPLFLVRNQHQGFIDVAAARRRLRDLGIHRERLFQAYVEGSAGDFFLRVGRQILSWGETDGFRLLDNINPLDSSFGGFLVSLDERRVPLDMGRAQYFIGDLGPFTEVFLEGYVAIDNKVGSSPGTPAGSPWALPSLGAPSKDAKSITDLPARTIKDARGGGRLVFNALSATFSVAHYYTYFDTPAIRAITSGYPDDNSKTLLNAFNDGQPCPIPDPKDRDHLIPDYSNRTCGAPAHALLTAPKIQVSGATTTFAIPQWYSVVRSELAYFKDEPAFTQGQLDPFIFNLGAPRAERRQTGGRRLRDSINAVLGIDANQWIRFLNPHQTFFISTQFFYKHILDAAGSDIFVTKPDGTRVINPDREVLPIRLDQAHFFLKETDVGRREPIYISQPKDQYLHTLFIGTSYRSGTISPGLLVFYDWGGGFVYQPEISFSRDPLRFAIDYTILDSHIYKGGSGVSLLKDRDNIQFRIEYVI